MVTDEQRGRIKRLWAEGYSSGIIANMVGATRNTVIGIVQRAKLPRPEFKLDRRYRSVKPIPRPKATNHQPIVCRPTSPSAIAPKLQQARFRPNDVVFIRQQKTSELSKDELRRQLTQAVQNTAKLKV